MKHSPLINETLLAMKFARIINLLAERLHVSPSRALIVFYESDVYGYMNRLEYHLHNMSDAYVVDEIMLELERKS